MSDTEYFDLPEMPGYVSTDQAAKMLGVSKQRVYQFVTEKRLPAFRVGNVILLPAEAVRQFKPNLTGRPRKQERPWRIYRGGSTVIGMDIEVRVKPGQGEHLRARLQAMREKQLHTLTGTIARYVLVDKSDPALVSIWLVWKDTEMPAEEARAAELEALRAELADVLDWDSARYSEKDGLIYT